jgi:hypothetical protein
MTALVAAALPLSFSLCGILRDIIGLCVSYSRRAESVSTTIDTLLSLELSNLLALAIVRKLPIGKKAASMADT